MIPPEWFPPWLQVYLYIYIFPTIVILTPIILIVVWKRWMPQPAKEIFWNQISKMPIINYETDSGYSVIERARSFPEGILVTKNSKQVFMVPRPISTTRIESVQRREHQEKQGKPEDFRLDLVEPELIQSVALRRSILKGSGSPFLHAYAGKAIASNLATLVGLEYSGESSTQQMSILDNLKKAIGKRGKGWIVNVLFPVDPRAMKKWFTHMWNQSQLRARDRASEQIGYEKGKGEFKRMMIPIVLIIILFVLGMVFLLVAGGGSGGAKPA